MRTILIFLCLAFQLVSFAEPKVIIYSQSPYIYEGQTNTFIVSVINMETNSIFVPKGTTNENNVILLDYNSFEIHGRVYSLIDDLPCEILQFNSMSIEQPERRELAPNEGITYKINWVWSRPADWSCDPDKTMFLVNVELCDFGINTPSVSLYLKNGSNQRVDLTR